ncbi:MAG: hypothetical protein M1575_03785 [Patescibacteria group bacterium]|nr:hypothetical protein [Patescibacteria group bacterium]
MRKLAKIGLSLGLLLTQVAPVIAADITIPDTAGVGRITIGSLIGGIVGVAILIAGLLAFIYLVWGGVEWISSGGDKAGMESARNRITAAFVGLGIVVASWAIAKLMGTFFGIDIFNITLPKAY